MAEDDPGAAMLAPLRERTLADAEKIIDELLPKKVLQLNKLYIETQAKLRDRAHVISDEELERYVHGLTDVVPVNSVVADTVGLLKNEIAEMLAGLSTVRLWVRLHMPRIEDGNNFGVVVQNEVLGMINTLYNSGLSFLRNLVNFFIKRGKILSKMRKRPNVKGYVTSLLDLDEKQYVTLVQSCCDLRNNYAFLFDKIQKNREKLVCPKGKTSSHLNMY